MKGIDKMNVEIYYTSGIESYIEKGLIYESDVLTGQVLICTHLQFIKYM